MDMLKNKDYHIKISNEQLKIMKRIAIQDRLRLSQIFERAIVNYLQIKWYNKLGNSLKTKG